MVFGKKSSLILLAVLFLSSLAFAPGGSDCATNPNAPGCSDSNPKNSNFTGAGGDIYDALQQLCQLVKNSLAVGMMFMVVSASLVYAVGQVMGAETRARASVWATSMFNGAIIAALIYLLVPFVLDILIKDQLGGASVTGLC